MHKPPREGNFYEEHGKNMPLLQTTTDRNEQKKNYLYLNILICHPAVVK
jgi:hypothetical protein